MSFKVQFRQPNKYSSNGSDSLEDFIASTDNVAIEGGFVVFFNGENKPENYKHIFPNTSVVRVDRR